MDQDNKPRFSHVTVGQTGADDISQLDDEETITIGAVGAVDAEQASRQPVRQEAMGTNRSVAVERQIDEPTPVSTSVDKLPDQAAEDPDFGPPMSLAQKLVIVACGVALVIVLVRLVHHWVFT
jgi:hypothetical protein